jgi:GT2 family glycosyltransferase
VADPQLSIIIVNFNGKQDLLRCLASLDQVRNEAAFEVIVVDNGSRDGSVEACESLYPHWKYIRAGSNLGFAAGCNRGLAAAAALHAMLLNPDTEITPGALPKLLSALETHPQWGIVGPRMVDPSDRLYPAARRFPTPFYLFCECTRLAYLIPHMRLFAGYFYGDCRLETLDAVDQVEGSALVIRAEARERVGLLDEQFFLFFEEVDLCRRVKDAGFEIHLVQDAVVRHYRSTAMRKSYITARKANAESAMRYFLKHHGQPGLKSLRRWMTAALFIRQTVTRMLAIISESEKAELRANGAQAERAVYRRGLPA